MAQNSHQQRPLETLLHKYLIVKGQWHLKRNERRAEYCQCSYDPEDIILLETGRLTNVAGFDVKCRRRRNKGEDIISDSRETKSIERSHAPSGQVFHEEVVAFRVVVWRCHSIIDTLQLRTTGLRADKFRNTGRN
jgi:hypothetical protein